jgi:hypothetical protein
MTLRIRAPHGVSAVTFGQGCNTSHQVVDGLVECSHECRCHAHAERAGFQLIDVPEPEEKREEKREERRERRDFRSERDRK